MWDEYQDLTPEERLDRIVEILTEGVLRLIEEKKAISSKKGKKASGQISSEEVLQENKKEFSERT
ncbi:MAG: hypothetical protein AB1349_07530 [Elusimicrobiota bacterium]